MIPLTGRGTFGGHLGMPRPTIFARGSSSAASGYHSSVANLIVVVGRGWWTVLCICLFASPISLVLRTLRLSNAVTVTNG